MEILYFQKSNVKNYIHLLLSLHIVAMPRLGIVADRYLYFTIPIITVNNGRTRTP